MKLFAARRAARARAAERQADIDVWKMRRIILIPERLAGDPLVWPLPGAPSEPARLFESLCCPDVSPLGQRCEKRAGHRTKAHSHALEVDDVLDERVATWREPARAKAVAS